MTVDGIRFLPFEEALTLHENQIKLYGGSPGIRDEGLLKSALAQPEAQFDGRYLHETIAAMAAAYLFHLVQNHPFVDGNKRIGTVCSTVFLELNGFELDPVIDELDAESGKTLFERIVLSVAEGVMTKDAVRGWIESVMRSAE